MNVALVHRREAISTVVGALIFLLIFFAAVSTIYFIMNNLSEYVIAVKEYQEQQAWRSSEKLDVYVYDNGGFTFVRIRNLSPNTVIVDYIWVNHTVVDASLVIASGKEVDFNTSQPYFEGIQVRVVTTKGNVFTPRFLVRYKADVIWGGDVYRYYENGSLKLVSRGLIFQDEFEGTSLNTTAWNTYIIDGGSAPSVSQGCLWLRSAMVLNKVAQISDCVVQIRVKSYTLTKSSSSYGAGIFARSSGNTGDQRSTSYVLNFTTTKEIYRVPPPPSPWWASIVNITRNLSIFFNERVLARNTNYGPDNDTWYIIKFALNGTRLEGFVYYDNSSYLLAKVYAEDISRTSGWFGLIDEDVNSISCFDYVRVYGNSTIVIDNVKAGMIVKLIKPNGEIYKRFEVLCDMQDLTIMLDDLPFPLKNWIIEIS
ncbi:MAG: hypothetical protein DRJ33_01670 [Candidatus Methanomethylicota archaeon]|uniref:Uncharacterized protein n=1 Tax=Thermoproteota archaeon TaxID=2056631 RepID=A0A497F2L7_9CREN|nr:MAG: hypothetical protein DRJ33_01670 [Candidatus Verstraetearchaeota archaeon]